MLKNLYHLMLEWAADRRARTWLAIVSFAESSFFPIPPDVMLLPMCLADRKRAFGHALVCTLASVAGALLGYAIGSLLFDTLGTRVLEFYGYRAKFDDFVGRYQAHGVWIVLIAGLTPFPFKVITIASGVAGLSLPVFIIASVVARGARFFLLAALLWKFGEPIRAFIDRYFAWLTIAFCALLIGGFVALRWVV
ncbi:DedA family protein [Gammaproteobacteria bacterium]|nr:DedA family protein [Gammaproteobacteria bacterium]